MKEFQCDKETLKSKHADMRPLFLSQSDRNNSKTIINLEDPKDVG